MDLKNVKLLVWDDPLNFNLPETKRQFGDGKLYNDVIQFQGFEEFQSIVKSLDDEDLVVVCCHVKYEDFSGVLDFRNSGIKDGFNNPEVVYLSSGDSGVIMQNLYDKYKISLKIILYNELIKDIRLGEITPIKVKQLSNKSAESLKETNNNKITYPQIDYALITALYEDEFEEVQKLFNFNEEDIIKTEKKEYHVGFLKTDTTKKIVVAIPSATGMVDAAIIATQMLEFFRPKYLMMSGVCGGKSDLSFGDIVVAKTIFVFQKGKISDINGKNDKGEIVEIELFDSDQNVIDYNHLYDKSGHQININIEKFEVEHDSILELDSLIKGRIERKQKDIQAAINANLESFGKKINIVMEPMACSTMVINKKGYFEDRIKILDRKTAAVEMESYGVARACMFANDGKTKAIIFKSVMDNMSQKGDDAKRFAAHTSAQFLKYLLEMGVI